MKRLMMKIGYDLVALSEETSMRVAADLMAALVGLVQGGVQSLSRSLFGRLVPEGKSAEYFGFYNMVGKFGTVLGPLLMGGTALAFGSTRASILALLLLFVGGGLLLWRVRFEPVQPLVSGQAAGSSR